MQSRNTIDYTTPAASLKMPMLRKLAAALKIEVKGDRRFRQTWIDAIEAYRAPVRTAESVLESLKVSQLNILCRQFSVTGYTSLQRKEYKVSRLLRVCDHIDLLRFCDRYFAA